MWRPPAAAARNLEHAAAREHRRQPCLDGAQVTLPFRLEVEPVGVGGPLRGSRPLRLATLSASQEQQTTGSTRSSTTYSPPASGTSSSRLPTHSWFAAGQERQSS